MYKLIAIDLDGTLLNSEKRISRENKLTLQIVMDRGVKVVVCSGRIFSGARMYAREIGSNGPLIACNGAIIRDIETDKLLYSNTMRKEDCFKVIDICKDEDIYFHAYVGDTMYTEKLGYSSLFYSNKNRELPEKDRIDIKVIASLRNVIENSDKPILKFVIVNSDKEKLLRLRKLLEKVNGIEVVSSNFDNIEVVNSGVDKGTSLKLLADKLSISREQIMAIGDNENDQTMLKYAGFSIAMGNAENYIKESADYITLTNNENGVAHAIQKFILADN